MIGTILQGDVEELIQEKRWDELREVLTNLDSSDIAEMISDLPAEDNVFIFRILSRQRAADVFAHLPADRQEDLLGQLSGEQMRVLMTAISPDDRTRLLEEMPAEVTRRLLEKLTPEQVRAAVELLGYPDESAGRYMTTQYVALRADMTAAEALAYIRKVGREKETLDVVYVLDEAGRLLQDLRLGTLVLAEPEAKVGELEDRPLVSVLATTDREDVVAAFEKYDRVAVPVTDASGVMLGIITVDDIMDVAEEEATEDAHKFGGVQALDEPYITVSTFDMFRKRGIWLSVLFVGQLMTATVMERYESQFHAAMERAFFLLVAFVPLIISSGGNSGSQATSLIIRAMAVREVGLKDWWKVLRREVVCAAMLGLWLGLLGLLRVTLWHQLGWSDYSASFLLIALTVSIALVGVVLWGSVVGSMLPFLLRRLGLDPATSSAPFVATLVDVTGLIIYFTAASLILTGRL